MDEDHGTSDRNRKGSKEMMSRMVGTISRISGLDMVVLERLPCLVPEEKEDGCVDVWYDCYQWE